MAPPAFRGADGYPTLSPEVVANAFVTQYYCILQQCPELVHRFYRDNSLLGRAEDDGAMSSTTSMDAIEAKVQSYGSLKADIKFVDVQESCYGGIVVVVTGSMINADESRRDFTQTFFLARHDNGFFILNDLFRYVDNDFHQNEVQYAGIALFDPDHEVPPVEEDQIEEVLKEVSSLVQMNHISNESNEEVLEEVPPVHGNCISDASNGDIPENHISEKFSGVVLEKVPPVKANHISDESNGKVLEEVPPDQENHNSEESNGELFEEVAPLQEYSISEECNKEVCDDNWVFV